MMTTFLKLYRSPFTQIAVFASFLIIDLILIGQSVGLSKSDWASWVQAVGSIAAILAAFLVADRQLRKSRQLDAVRIADEMTRKAHIINAVLINISGIGMSIDAAGNNGDGQFLQNFDTSVLSHQAALLRSIPPLDIPTAGIIYAITDLPQKLNALESCIVNGQNAANANPAMAMFYMEANGLKQKSLAVVRTSLDAMKQCREVIPELQ